VKSVLRFGRGDDGRYRPNFYSNPMNLFTSR